MIMYAYGIILKQICPKICLLLLLKPILCLELIPASVLTPTLGLIPGAVGSGIGTGTYSFGKRHNFQFQNQCQIINITNWFWLIPQIMSSCYCFCCSAKRSGTGSRLLGDWLLHHIPWSSFMQTALDFQIYRHSITPPNCRHLTQSKRKSANHRHIWYISFYGQNVRERYADFVRQQPGRARQKI